jgi:hypothetical protein
MRNIFLEIIILSLFVISCKEEIQVKEIDSKILKESVIYYLDSSKQDINNLSNIFSNIKEPSKNYNKILVDSIILNNKKHFVILLEHPIPIFNLFAILNDSLELLLLDNSINGYLNYSKLTNGVTDYIQLTENFKSLDVFNLTRISLFRKVGDGINLVFRGIISFNSPKDSVINNLTTLTDSIIVCTIPKSKVLVQNEITYKYVFDPALKRFFTQKDFMDSLIKKEINNFANEFSPNQILNKKSYIDILNERFEDTVMIVKSEYEFSIPSDWIALDNISFYKILKKKVKGTYFVNKRLGINIGLIKIPDFENSEDYVNATFTVQKQLRNYQIRESIVQEDIKYFSQAIEHECAGTKYLIIIEGSKNVYRKNQEYIRDILSSFAINCE